jgi:hypothetical protein
MNDTERRALIDRTPLVCPLCATPTGRVSGRAYVLLAIDDSGPIGERRRCPSCRLVVVLPRVPLAAAIKRSGRA